MGNNECTFYRAIKFYLFQVLIMTKFISRLFILAIADITFILLLFAFYYFVIGNQYALTYNAAFFDKLKRLESINEPKIILVGNSNVAFGFCSELIEKSIGMPVVNLGLHVDLGNSFLEEMAKFNINKGDIVVICHSSYFDNDKINNCDLAWATIDCNLNYLSVVRRKDITDMLVALPKHLRMVFYRWCSGAGKIDLFPNEYGRKMFNKYCDIEQRPPLKGTFNIESRNFVEPKYNSFCIDRLNDFYSYLKIRGAEMIIAGYPIYDIGIKPDEKQKLKNFTKALDAQLDCDVISDFSEYIFQQNLFYDTYLHLSEEGAKIRTKKFIEDYFKWLKNKDYK